MAAPTKNQKIESLVKLVQKRSRGAGLTTPPQRTVLETLMYAALLENSTFDKADNAYTVLENYYIDWNEIRVCSIRELADTLSNLPSPEAAAERVRKALQGVFEKTYMFDLEELRKKGKALAEHIKFLESIAAGTPYMIQYVAQVALDGHVIPLDESSMRIMRRLGLSQVSSEGTQEICTGLDRVVLKKSGPTFAAQLHHFAAGYFDVPDSPELLAQLSAIDPEAVNRSWVSPISATPPSGNESAITTEPAIVETPAELPVAPKESPKEMAPVSLPEKKAPPKSTQQAAKKPATEPTKPAPKKTSAKPVKTSVKVKKTPPKTVKPKSLPKASKKSGNVVVPKKKVLPKTPSKPLPTKKKVKAVVKKGLVKPAKKTKAASPSKALRKKKPK